MKVRYKTTTNTETTTITYQQIANVANIPNILFHFDAAGLVSGTANTYGTVDMSNNVSVWNNMVSPNGLSQLAGASQPVLDIDINGIKSVNFNGTSNFFTFANVFSLYRCTILFIFKPTVEITSSSTQQMILGPDVNQAIDTYFGFGNLSTLMSPECLYFFSYNNNNNTYRGSFSRCGPIVTTKINALTAMNNDYCTIVGGYDATPPFGTVRTDEIAYNRVIPYEYSLLNTKYFGARRESMAFLNGKVYEMMIFDNQINSDEVLYIKQYINEKYGI